MSKYRELLEQYECKHAAIPWRWRRTEVIGWIPYDAVAAEDPERIGGWGGVIQPGHRWKDYAAMHNGEYGPYYKALKREILRLGLKRGGDWHQNDPEGVPVFNDGAVGIFGFRAWGDLMAAIWADRENRDYGYMDFYMDSCIKGDPAD